MHVLHIRNATLMSLPDESPSRTSSEKHSAANACERVVTDSPEATQRTWLEEEEQLLPKNNIPVLFSALLLTTFLVSYASLPMFCRFHTYDVRRPWMRRSLGIDARQRSTSDFVRQTQTRRADRDAGEMKEGRVDSRSVRRWPRGVVAGSDTTLSDG